MDHRVRRKCADGCMNGTDKAGNNRDADQKHGRNREYDDCTPAQPALFAARNRWASILMTFRAKLGATRARKSFSTWDRVRHRFWRLRWRCTAPHDQRHFTEQVIGRKRIQQAVASPP